MRRKSLGARGACVIVLAVLTAVLLIPIFQVGIYDRIFADDYFFGGQAHRALVEGEGVFGVLRAALETVARTYINWQGTYSAIFLFALNPGIGAPQFYALTPWLMIGVLVAALGYFCNRVCRLVLRTGHAEWLFAWLLASFLCVQFIKNPQETFYWYNGGVYYSCFFALMLAALGLVLTLVLRGGLSRAGLAWRGALLTLLCAVLAGGSFPVILLSALLLAACFVWSLIKNHRAALPLGVALGIFLVGFAVSVFAPGNAVRSSVSYGMGPIEAIISSLLRTPIVMCGRLLEQYGIVLALLLLWLPLCLYAQREPVYRYRWPWLPPLLSWIILAVMLTPSMYGIGNNAPYRLWNIIYFAFYLLLMANMFYWTGWFRRRYERAYMRVYERMTGLKRWAAPYVAVCVAAALLIGAYGPDIIVEKVTPTCAAAVRELADGTARRYAAEWDEDYETIVNSTSSHVILEPISVVSELLPESGFAHGFAWWGLGPWYGKEYIGTKEEENDPYQYLVSFYGPTNYPIE